MITIKNADAALKDYYLDAFTAQLNDNISPFFSAIEKNTDNVSGKDVKLAVVRGNTGGIVGGSEDGDLPKPYKNRYINLTAPLKNIYGTIEISDKAMRASRESSGAFVNLVNAEMEGLISSAKENFRRMLFGNGSAKLFTIKSKYTTNACYVDNCSRYFSGMHVDIYDSNGDMVTGEDGIYVTDVDTESKVVAFNKEFDSSFTNGSVYVHGSKDGEITGLDAVFEFDGSIYGNDKKDEPYLIPYRYDSEGDFDENLLCDILDYMEECRNSKINMILCSYKTRKMIASLIKDGKRVVNTIDVHTGYGEITVNNVPVYADKYCPDNRIYFLNTDDFALYQLCDWEWLEDEDGKILKQIPGKAAYSATLVKYAELVCRNPYSQAMLYGFDVN